MANETWLIASDLHGSAEACKKILEAVSREKANRILLLGDLLYHGPRNPLPASYDPKAVAQMLNEHKQDILCVRGNCDAEVDQMMLEFPILAEYAFLCIGDWRIFATHGHTFHKNALPPLQKGDILLHGHTHVPACEDLFGDGSYFYMNPGSASLPKEDKWAGYIILTEDSISWKNMDGTCMMEHRKCCSHSAF